MVQPLAARLAEEGDAPENVLGSLRPEARQAGEPAVAGRGLELDQRVDAEQLVDLTDLGDPEAGNSQHLYEARGNLGPQLLEPAHSTGGRQLGDDLQRGRSDTPGARQRPARQRILQTHLQPCDCPRGASEGADPELVFPLQLEESGDLLEHVGGGTAIDGRRARHHAARSRARYPSSSSSSSPAIECRPAAVPPGRVGAKSAAPSARASRSTRGPAASTTVKPSLA